MTVELNEFQKGLGEMEMGKSGIRGLELVTSARTFFFYQLFAFVVVLVYALSLNYFYKLLFNLCVKSCHWILNHYLIELEFGIPVKLNKRS